MDDVQANPASPGASSKPGAESAETPAEAADPRSIDNIARFFGGKTGGGKPGAFPRPSMNIPAPTGAANLKKNDRVRHSKYGEGTILMREGDGEDAKLTVLFSRHGMKKLMEKFANLLHKVKPCHADRSWARFLRPAESKHLRLHFCRTSRVSESAAFPLRNIIPSPAQREFPCFEA
jgi:hypothetical protein